jgi:hypothetical protein
MGPMCEGGPANSGASAADLGAQPCCRRNVGGDRGSLVEPMLWTIVLILVVLWLLGFSFHIAGGLVHLLLVIALIVLAFQRVQMFTGRRASWPKRDLSH